MSAVKLRGEVVEVSVDLSEQGEGISVLTTLSSIRCCGHAMHSYSPHQGTVTVWIHDGGECSCQYCSVLVLLLTVYVLLQLLNTCTLDVVLGKVFEAQIHIYSNMKMALLFAIYNPKYLFLFGRQRKAVGQLFSYHAIAVLLGCPESQ